MLYFLALAALAISFSAASAGKGRFNDDGKPYIQDSLLVKDIPANARIFRHQVLGLLGMALAAVLAVMGVAVLRGRIPNRYLVVVLTVLLAVLWGIGGHLGGMELWGPDTFPAFH